MKERRLWLWNESTVNRLKKAIRSHLPVGSHRESCFLGTESSVESFA
jgi:hypothetical protein